MRDILKMSHRELKKLKVVEQAIAGEVRQREAAEILELSVRQIKRLVRRVRMKGCEGVIHGGRDRPSNNRFQENEKEKVLSLCREKYHGFGPTLASEKLLEINQVEVSRETLRGWLGFAEIEYPRRKKRPHRQWRERKAHCGEMIQMDGSRHAWFEKRGPECTLMGYVDDATGRVFARFYSYEGTVPALDSFRRYISAHGIPLSVYLDRHTTYKAVSKPTIEDELNDRQPLSQFARAVEELGVRVIHAYSPQAKGRIERLFGTFQDRMIKEMRLQGISNMKDGNNFLEKYLPIFNRRFGRPSKSVTDLHRPSPGYPALLQTLCVRTERTVRNDGTIFHECRHYQLLGRICLRKIMVEERLNGHMVIRGKGREIEYREINGKPKPKERDVPTGIRIGGILLDVVVAAEGKIEKFRAPMGAVHEGRQTF